MALSVEHLRRQVVRSPADRSGGQRKRDGWFVCIKTFLLCQAHTAVAHCLTDKLVHFWLGTTDSYGMRAST